MANKEKHTPENTEAREYSLIKRVRQSEEYKIEMRCAHCGRIEAASYEIRVDEYPSAQAIAEQKAEYLKQYVQVAVSKGWGVMRHEFFGDEGATCPDCMEVMRDDQLAKEVIYVPSEI